MIYVCTCVYVYFPLNFHPFQYDHLNFFIFSLNFLFNIYEFSTIVVFILPIEYLHLDWNILPIHIINGFNYLTSTLFSGFKPYVRIFSPVSGILKLITKSMHWINSIGFCLKILDLFPFYRFRLKNFYFKSNFCSLGFWSEFFQRYKVLTDSIGPFLIPKT